MAQLSLEDVRLAYGRIQSSVHRTPVVTSAYFDRVSGRQLFFKAENLQKTGSFKARGACNSVFSIKEQHPEVAGIVTHSSGNHGQATAYAAQLVGVPCKVIVTQDTAEAKTDAIRSYGAEVIFCEPTLLARRETCAAVAEQTGFAIIQSSEDPRVIAGQGTIALEFLQQVPDLDAILVSVSGGGMAAGVATATKELRPECKEVSPFLNGRVRVGGGSVALDSSSIPRQIVQLDPSFNTLTFQNCFKLVIAVEPFGKGLGPSLRAGRPLWSQPPRLLDTLADGCRVQPCGPLAFSVLRRLLEPAVLAVRDQRTAAVTRLFWQRTKLLIEPSAGMAVAAAISGQLAPELRRVGVVLCGGNVDLDNLPWAAAGADGPSGPEEGRPDHVRRAGEEACRGLPATGDIDSDAWARDKNVGVVVLS